MATKCNRWLVSATFIQKYNISRFYQKQIPRSIDSLFIEGLFTQKKSSYPPPKKNLKNPKKIQKSKKTEKIRI